MSGSPKLKVYNQTGEYIGSLKYGEDAAALVAVYGDGATIRYGHSRAHIVWNEGTESFPAGESYDGVAQLIQERIRAKYEAAKLGHQERYSRT